MTRRRVGRRERCAGRPPRHIDFAALRAGIVHGNVAGGVSFRPYTLICPSAVAGHAGRASEVCELVVVGPDLDAGAADADEELAAAAALGAENDFVAAQLLRAAGRAPC